MVSPLLGLDGTADHSPDLNGIRCFLTLPTHRDQSQVIKQKTALNMEGCSCDGQTAAAEVDDSSLKSDQGFFHSASEISFDVLGLLLHFHSSNQDDVQDALVWQTCLSPLALIRG